MNPSLLRMLRTWVSTVRSDMNRWAPICLLLRPSATNRATSVSRLPSSLGPPWRCTSLASAVSTPPPRSNLSCSGESRTWWRPATSPPRSALVDREVLRYAFRWYAGGRGAPGPGTLCCRASYLQATATVASAARAAGAVEALVNMSPLSVSQISLANAERASVKKPPWS